MSAQAPNTTTSPRVLDDDAECAQAQADTHLFWPPCGTLLSSSFLRSWVVAYACGGDMWTPRLTTAGLALYGGQPLFPVRGPVHIGDTIEAVRDRTDRLLASADVDPVQFRQIWERVAAHLGSGDNGDDDDDLVGAWWSLLAAEGCGRQPWDEWSAGAARAVWPPYSGPPRTGPGWNEETAADVGRRVQEWTDGRTLARCLSRACRGEEGAVECGGVAMPAALVRRRIMDALGL